MVLLLVPMANDLSKRIPCCSLACDDRSLGTKLHTHHNHAIDRMMAVGDEGDDAVGCHGVGECVEPSRTTVKQWILFWASWHYSPYNRAAVAAAVSNSTTLHRIQFDIAASSTTVAATLTTARSMMLQQQRFEWTVFNLVQLLVRVSCYTFIDKFD